MCYKCYFVIFKHTTFSGNFFLPPVVCQLVRLHNRFRMMRESNMGILQHSGASFMPCMWQCLKAKLHRIRSLTTATREEWNISFQSSVEFYFFFCRGCDLSFLQSGMCGLIGNWHFNVQEHLIQLQLSVCVGGCTLLALGSALVFLSCCCFCFVLLPWMQMWPCTILPPSCLCRRVLSTPAFSSQSINLS